VRIVLRALQECGAVDIVAPGIVKAARVSFPSDPVALNVAQVRARRSAFTESLPGVARPYRHAPSTGCNQTRASQHAWCRAPPAYPCNDVASLSDGFVGGFRRVFENAFGRAQIASTVRIADASELWLQVICRHVSLP
jgi:hypothetical protein